MKHAQLSSMALAGTIVLIVFLFLLMAFHNEASSVDGFQLSKDREIVATFADQCLQSVLLDALNTYGLQGSAPAIKKSIEEGLPACLDEQLLNEHGIAITQQKPSAVINISAKAVIAHVHMPITIKRGASSETITDFSQSISRSAAKKVTEIVSHNIQLVAPDMGAVLKIAKGTKLVLNNGESIKYISLSYQDKLDDGLSNGLVVGELVYKALPEGLQFSEPASLTIHYSEDAVPDDIMESSLAIAWYDASGDIWRSLPSVVDPATNRITAEINHFSLFAIVKYCTKGQNRMRSYLRVGWIYREPYAACDAWEISDKLSGFAIGTDERLKPVEPELPVTEWLPDHEPEVFYQCIGECFKDTWSKKPCSCSDEKCLINAAKGLCKQVTWYGYKKFADIAGRGTFLFQLLENGDSCVPEKMNAKILFYDYSAPEDIKKVIMNGVSIPIEKKDIDYKQKIVTIETGKLISGLNELVVVMKHNGEHTNACLHTQATLVLEGKGYLPDCPLETDTVNLHVKGKPCQCGGISAISRRPAANTRDNYVCCGGIKLYRLPKNILPGDEKSVSKFCAETSPLGSLTPLYITYYNPLRKGTNCNRENGCDTVYCNSMKILEHGLPISPYWWDQHALTGGIACPRDLGCGTKIYIPFEDGRYAKLVCIDLGGSIVKKNNGRIDIDILHDDGCRSSHCGYSNPKTSTGAILYRYGYSGYIVPSHS